jgi:hypothetical protein
MRRISFGALVKTVLITLVIAKLRQTSFGVCKQTPVSVRLGATFGSAEPAAVPHKPLSAILTNCLSRL